MAIANWILAPIKIKAEAEGFEAVMRVEETIEA